MPGTVADRSEPDVYGTNVDVTQKDVDQLSEADIDRLIYGSKCQQGAWYCYTALLWSMKVRPLSVQGLLDSTMSTTTIPKEC